MKKTKKFIHKFNDFFIYWFWWKWRAIKYDKDSNKYRQEIFSALSDYQKKYNAYIYVGFGSVLKHYRDKTIKDEDIDIVISREEFEKKRFKNFIMSQNWKFWQDYYDGDEIIIYKLLKNKICPIEFFIVDLKKDKELVKTYMSGKLTYVEAKKQYITIIETDFGKAPMPKLMLEYILGWYGEEWNIPKKKYDEHKETQHEYIIK